MTYIAPEALKLMRWAANDEARENKTLSEALHAREKAHLTGQHALVEALDRHIQSFAKEIPLDVAGANAELRAVLYAWHDDADNRLIQKEIDARHITPEGVEDAYVPVQARYAEKIAKIAATADKAREQANQLLEHAITKTLKPTGDATQQLLDETRAARAWARIEKKLTTSDEPFAVIREALKTGDRATMRIISEEAPHALDERLPDAGHHIWNLISDQVPEIASARHNVNRAEKYAAVVKFNAKIALETVAKRPMKDQTIDQLANGLVLAEPRDV